MAGPAEEDSDADEEEDNFRSVFNLAAFGEESPSEGAREAAGRSSIGCGQRHVADEPDTNVSNIPTS